MSRNAELMRILDTCQDGLHAELLVQLTALQRQMSIEDFWQDFSYCLKCYLVVGERHIEVDRGLDFIAKFAATCDGKLHEDEPDKIPFLSQLWEFVLEHHQAKSPAIRMRVCQMIAQLLKNMSDEATIDDQLFDRTCKTMLERLEDKVACVRTQAAHALLRLQDPSSEHCLVIRAYLFHLEKDPSADVRKAILTNLAASKRTLTAVFRRTQDTEASVRAAASLFFSEKIHYRCLSIAKRVQLLHEGLRDRSEMVKNIVKRKLLPAWVKLCNNSPLDLLIALDVENSSEEAELVMKAYFDSIDVKDLVADFTARQPIPVTELTCATAFYWRCLAQHLPSLAVKGAELLEKMLPDLPPLCIYIRQYVEQLANATVDQLLEQEFVVHQLILIASIHDTVDECGRKSLLNLIQWLLMGERTSIYLVEPLVESVAGILTNQENVTNFVLEVIAELRDPIAETEAVACADDRRQQELQCIKNRDGCQPDGSQGNCCSGFCHKEPGWVAGYCK